ncbi:lysophospholipid acyltransferase family protein [Alkalihalophilus marmarensis]|jgi:1-acyl-sn-glycerol-3-phosphate acyltransferase|uniref:lysophospholipid acyltransferase family protein n=1 Tax=Alkalihalophilus marmarensis TaxID=521377 RepID=UPI002040C8BB|nr:lysophospholipid acyltransferase family protein [Alkalihalophilus marmarensis]MCM3490553.1 lysophospholipid acyltransferase family protein [Alkalihalophilus marmarensis]
MIKDKKSVWFSKVFHFYTTHWLLKRSFYSVNLKGTFPKTDRPLLLIANHSSWWDGLVSFYLSNECLRHESFAMMSEEGMKSYSFFRKIGTFSVNPSDSRSLLDSLNYARTKLTTKQALWFFPQGAEQHLEKRPLEFKSGVGYLLKDKKDVLVVPLTYYYTFRHEQKPELYIHVGTAIENNSGLGGNRKEITRSLEKALTRQLEEQKEELVLEKPSEYQSLLQSGKTVSEWLQTFTLKGGIK